MVPLGRTNKATSGVKLFQRPSCPDMYTVAVFVLYSTHSGSSSVPVNGLIRLRLPTDPQRPPHPPPTRPPPIELIHDIGGIQKKVSQNLAVLAR